MSQKRTTESGNEKSQPTGQNEQNQDESEKFNIDELNSKYDHRFTTPERLYIWLPDSICEANLVYLGQKEAVQINPAYQLKLQYLKTNGNLKYIY